MSYLLRLLLMLFVSKGVLSIVPNLNNVNNTHINCYRSYTIERTPRPLSMRVLNIREESLSYDSTPLSRHHIIPYATMRNFYNRLIENRAHFQHLFEQVLHIAAVNIGLDLRDDAEQTRNYPLDESLPGMLRNHLEMVHSPSYQARTAQELYAWLPFNIFIGPQPTIRNDDPQSNHFEQNAYVIIGRSRSDLLRRIHGDINQYLDGNNANPTAIIDELADLIRITPLPYSFNINQWRIHRTTNRYAIATLTIVSDPNYRPLINTDYCSQSGAVATFNRYNPPEFELRRSRRDVRHIVCLLDDEGAIYDPFCIKSLDLLRDLVKDNVLSYNNAEIKIIETTKPDEPSNCRPGVVAVTSAVSAGGAAYAACMLVGGLYFPGIGWAGCAIGSLVYAVTGSAAGAGIHSLVQC